MTEKKKPGTATEYDLEMATMKSVIKLINRNPSPVVRKRIAIYALQRIAAQDEGMPTPGLPQHPNQTSLNDALKADQERAASKAIADAAPVQTGPF